MVVRRIQSHNLTRCATNFIRNILVGTICEGLGEERAGTWAAQRKFEEVVDLDLRVGVTGVSLGCGLQSLESDVQLQGNVPEGVALEGVVGVWSTHHAVGIGGAWVVCDETGGIVWLADFGWNEKFLVCGEWEHGVGHAV